MVYSLLKNQGGMPERDGLDRVYVLPIIHLGNYCGNYVTDGRMRCAVRGRAVRQGQVSAKDESAHSRRRLTRVRAGNGKCEHRDGKF